MTYADACKSWQQWQHWQQQHVWHAAAVHLSTTMQPAVLAVTWMLLGVLNRHPALLYCWNGWSGFCMDARHL